MKKTKPKVQKNKLIVEHSQNSSDLVIEVGSNAWYKWLENHNGFIYEGDTGHFTARVEFRRGAPYWYAYRRRDGKLSKIY
ncbi:MAG: hypothetical protein IH585_07030, partial [Anaerolineaceae bacterium]|nr:hypothetical protein [Anaerolineaceae bacterium]